MKRFIVSILMFLMVAFSCARGSAELLDTNGSLVRPELVDGVVPGTWVSQTGDYSAIVGDLIECDYGYAVIPGAIPEKIDYALTQNGSVQLSYIGIRAVNPMAVGATTYAFFFKAKRRGDDTITIIVDDQEYQYDVHVQSRFEQ
jgi:hypothetical protein